MILGWPGRRKRTRQRAPRRHHPLRWLPYPQPIRVIQRSAGTEYGTITAQAGPFPPEDNAGCRQIGGRALHDITCFHYAQTVGEYAEQLGTIGVMSTVLVATWRDG